MLIIFLIFLYSICNLSTSVNGSTVGFDGRSFLINGQRQLFIAGSVHYPRAPRQEWSTIFKLSKDQGINLIQTYVFWDIHEPENNSWYFPDSNENESSDNLVAFVKEAAKQGLYVHLRIAGYICAEWNFGGLPNWLRDDMNITLRTFDDGWMRELSEFVEKTISVMKDARLLASQGGPIIMLQIENEYGNMEKYYGARGRLYVDWLSNYVKSLQLEEPWVMCQQGEGIGTSPTEAIVNACNGFYCDNWIGNHAIAFPGQPHMWTENWPGWFQNWGAPVPHRPAVDVAFAVANWYALGGTYMNYYMLYGGTTYGRSVGGPLIVTSYDYDVQINEYAQQSEPKYSLLKQLHQILLEFAPTLLNQMPPAEVKLPTNGNCGSYIYSNSGACLVFYINRDEHQACSFSDDITVPAWSTSIAALAGEGTSDACDRAPVIYNTKTNANNIQSTQKSYTKVEDFKLYEDFAFQETLPSEDASMPNIYTTLPQMQLTLTKDATDYLWYSTIIPTNGEVASNQKATIKFTSGNAGGGLYYYFVNGAYSGSTLGSAGANPIGYNAPPSSDISAADFGVPVKIEVTIPAGVTNPSLDILSVSMGLKNYGPYLEKIQVGIISNFTIDDRGIVGFKHSVGLVGENLNFFDKKVILPKTSTREGSLSDGRLTWHSLTFQTPSNIISGDELALDLGLSMGKGAAWVNGHMLGRYWNITAVASVSQGSCSEPRVISDSCSSMQYTGSFNPDRCRTGCGEPSQSYYKLPFEWLYTSESGEINKIVLFEESGGKNPQDIKLFIVKTT